MSQGDWHHGLSSAETEEVALVDVGAAWPVPDWRVVGFDVSRGDLVCVCDALTGVCFLDGILVAEAVAVWSWGEVRLGSRGEGTKPEGGCW